MAEEFDCSAVSRRTLASSMPSSASVASEPRQRISRPSGSGMVLRFLMRAQHAARQGVEREGVGEVADAPPAPHPRQRGLLGEGGEGRAFPGDAGRHLVAVGAARGLDLDLDQQDRPGWPAAAPHRRGARR